MPIRTRRAASNTKSHRKWEGRDRHTGLSEAQVHRRRDNHSGCRPSSLITLPRLEHPEPSATKTIGSGYGSEYAAPLGAVKIDAEAETKERRS